LTGYDWARLTDEQKSVLQAVWDGKRIISVNAGAGSGKTSVLEAIAALPFRERTLYTQFSSEGVKDAAARFPAGISCRTSHSLAWEQTPGPMKARKRASVRVGSRKLAERLKITPRIADDHGYRTPAQMVNALLTVVNNFCHSADDEFMMTHVPETLPDREVICAWAASLWERDITQADGVTPYQHDYYQKQWQLRKPRMNYGRILADESQDVNPCFLDIIARQSAQLILVGDSSQALYEWRGAIDAMDAIVPDEWLALTGSFRFGPEIAERANRFLALLDARIRLTGLGVAGEVGPCDPDAVMCRTNAETMRQAMAFLADGRSVGLAGRVAGDLLAFARGGLALRGGRGTDHPDLCGFRSWADVKTHAETDADGQDLAVFVRLVEAHGEGLITALESMSADGQAADVTCSTVHRAKGLQWPRVTIAPDLGLPEMASGEPNEWLADRRREDAAFLRVCYVAVTRAQSGLDDSALEWVDSAPDQQE